MPHFIDINVEYVLREPVLSHTDFTITKGHIALIEGDNGSGKTTLMKYISGLIDLGLDNPTVIDFLKVCPRRFYYFPEDHLFKDFTVREFIFLCSQQTRWRGGKGLAALNQAFSNALSELNIKAKPTTLIKELSSGNRTLLRFLNLYINNYDVLLLDEPSSHLDDEKARILLACVAKYVFEHNCYCVISSHDPRLYRADVFQNSHYKFRIQGAHIVKKW